MEIIISYISAHLKYRRTFTYQTQVHANLAPPWISYDAANKKKSPSIFLDEPKVIVSLLN